ncbi:MAG: aspartate aminotransferase family protein [Dehalococcoidia bacterium]|nr:Acetylornithine aminotransferase [Chloroflexota bacterium]MBT9159365.1 Acetylornithine aminotransferase [Chloroflexota bacterium]MBT9162687.1 Acetylornithine aminotransferase [Chloroflexota bacterium]
MSNWAELEKKYFMATFKRLPVTLVRGEGIRAWDDAGKGYLDFVGGWAVNVLGHAHPVIVNALNEQAHTLIQVSNQFYTIPQLRLAELLVENSCLDKVFFSNSGAEANEGAIKLTRKYGRIHLDGAYEIITALGSFHGRTMATIAATGQHKFQEPFVPLPGGFINVEYNNIEAIKAATSALTCAVMLEPIQGENGVNIPDGDYFHEVRKWCDDNGLLLILDEIQTGVGRTGTLFAYEQLGIEPDIMTLAKGLGGGVPIAAILAREKAAVFSPGEHGSTFGGNPLVCAVGYAVLRFILENGVLANVREVGAYLMGELNKLRSSFDFITDVRGRGLLVALEFESEISGKVIDTCIERGLLLNPVKPNAIRFMPPLITQRSDVDTAISILKDALIQI